jgi:hypothetical protein
MLRKWYRPRDLLGFVDEPIITGDDSRVRTLAARSPASHAIAAGTAGHRGGLLGRQD